MRLNGTQDFAEQEIPAQGNTRGLFVLKTCATSPTVGLIPKKPLFIQRLLLITGR